MKIFTSILLLASLALNVAFLTGCVSPDTFLGKDGPSTGNDGRAHLVHIAKILDMPTAEKTAFVLESDISHALEHDVIVPVAFDDAEFEKMAKDLTSREEEAMRDYHRFILSLQDKRVIAIGGAD